MTEPRPDLLDALLASCFTVEKARADVLRSWGGEFAAEGDAAAQRAQIILDVCTSRGISVPSEVVEGHTGWMRSVVGTTPEQVPLGPAVAHRLSAWTDVYAVPYVGEEADRFRKLGEAELQIPVPPRHVERAETEIASVELPEGRRFVVLTDIHIGAPGTESLARRAVRDINELSPEFVVVPGDITDDGEPEQFALGHEILSGLEVPFTGVLGNHDAVRRTTQGAEGHHLYEEAFGTAPTDKVLECGRLQIALVDTTDPVPSPFPDWDLARGGFREDSGGTNGGALREGQAEALAAELDPDRPTLIVCHHEWQPFAAFPPVMFGLRDTDSKAIAAALAGHHVVGIMAGHTHRSALSQVEGGIPQLEVPALKDWPACYTVVTVTDDDAHVALRQLSDRDLVWEHTKQVPPIYLGYVLGPLSRLEHSFPFQR